MRTDKSHFKVLVLNPLSSIAGRMKLNGINHFLNEGHDWQIELVRSEAEFTPEMRESISGDSYDGIFIGTRETDEIRKLRENVHIPMVQFGEIDESTPMGCPQRHICFRDDVKSIVSAALHHFNSIGSLVSYAFVPSRKPTFWSEERERMFIAETAKKGIRAEVFRGGDLAAWLRTLPKPAGVLCAFDDRATDVLGACRSAKIHVPDDISVLGIGNDMQICEHTRPRLSSIEVDFEQQGYRAARELHAMMMRRIQPKEHVIAIGSATTIVRSSTLRESPAGILVKRAATFIDAKATHGATPGDVAQHVRVSRRLLDLRFREVTGKSVQQALRERRLDAVRHLLSTTTMTIGEIAVKCGYQDDNYLKNQFKRAFGTSMRKFRSATRQSETAKSLNGT